MPWVHNQSLSDHTRAKNRKMLILKSIRKQRPDVFESNIKNIIILSSKTLCGCEKKPVHRNKKIYKNNLDVQAFNNPNAMNRKP